MSQASTGNTSKIAAIIKKKNQKKTNMALAAILAVLGLGGLGYLVYRNRGALAAGGTAAAKQLGPVVSRLLPALVLGAVSMVVGPEGAIAGVPIGLLFGPQILGTLGGLMEGVAGEQAAGAIAAAGAGAGAALAGPTAGAEGGGFTFD